MKFHSVILAVAVLLVQGVLFAESAAQNTVVVVTPEPARQQTSRAVADEVPARNTNPDNSNPAPPEDQEDIDDYVPVKYDVSQFDWVLTKAILRNNRKNVILSPVSVKLILSVLGEAAGMNTTTKNELTSVVHSIESPFQSRELFKRIFESLRKKSNDYIINLATRIYADEYVSPKQRYMAIAEMYYYTDVKIEPFQDAAIVTEKVNQWVSNITNNHITQLVKQRDIENSVLVMLNAIYFKGLWRRPFFENETFTSDFHVGPNERKSVQFMSQTGAYFYVESAQLNAKILRIPYKGRKFAMFVILPNDRNKFEELVDKIDSTTIQNVKWYMDEIEVHVVLPKFKFDYNLNLNTVLQDLGIKEMFTTQASFPLLARGAAVQNKLQVSNVIQKAGLIVDEKGSTAYAATEVSLVNKFGDDGVREFIANQPFIFVIEDETTQQMMFSGKVQDPTEM